MNTLAPYLIVLRNCWKFIFKIFFLIENNKQFEVIVCEQTVELKLAE